MKTLKLSVSVGTYLNPWWFSLKDPDSLKVFCPFHSQSWKTQGEQEPWLPAVLIGALRQDPFLLETSDPLLSLGRREFLLALLFNGIDLVPWKLVREYHKPSLLVVDLSISKISCYLTSWGLKFLLLCAFSKAILRLAKADMVSMLLL